MKFVLPGFYEFMTLNIELYNLLERNPEYFYPEVEISSIYGCFPGQIWNGGRTIPSVEGDSFLCYVDYFNRLGIPCRFTYTNCCLDESDYNDKFCNYITKHENKCNNEILVNDEGLEKYLRDKYKGYNYVSSITKDLDEESFNKELEKDYKFVVLDFRKNNDFEYLRNIEKKDKVEILLNSGCNPECSLVKEHYKHISECQKLNKREYFECPYKGRNVGFHERKRYKTFVTVEDLYTKYKDLGFNCFKIAGRGTNELDVIENYVYYLVKDEYKDIVRFKLTDTCIYEINVNGGHYIG